MNTNTQPAQRKEYGAWDSPISSDLIASANIKLSFCTICDDRYFWLETRPAEAGRSVVVCRDREGKTFDVTPAPFNVRNTVHEYGGGSFIVSEDHLYFSNYADQRIYRQQIGHSPEAISSSLPSRYADFVFDHTRNRLIFIREDHSYDGEPINSLDVLALDGDGQPETLLTGSDFFAAPKISPDGRLLAWITWNHPHMPWDDSKLWTANIGKDGSLSNMQHVAGGKGQSVLQPEWGPDGTLYFISDESGWWNIHASYSGLTEPLIEMEAEFGLPLWNFGQSSYSVVSENTIICSFNNKGAWNLARIDIEKRELSTIETPFQDISFVRATENKIILRGGSPTDFPQIALIDTAKNRIETLKRSNDTLLDKHSLSAAELVQFSNAEGADTYAFFYAPKNTHFIGPEGQLPPLIVKSHGGPTAAATSTLDLGIQYWTSRGFAVVDVNYGGSTGYGKAYRERLNGNWGITDVNDCVSAAKFLVNTHKADPERLVITGSSAGGYTVLCALTFQTIFKAGASYYGISDLEALANDTHKFESRYHETLVGLYPAQAAIFKERSPINYPEKLNCPIIFFQGLEDKVVPPSQSEKMAEALRRKKLPVAYLTFAGEQHGFRQAETIKRCLNAELYFYCRIFGIERPDLADTISIDNL